MDTIEQILKASDQIIKARPSYKEILEFYSQIFSVQIRCRQSINLDPIIIDENLLSIKLENNMPLINPNQFLIDQEPTRKLFLEICDLAIELSPGFALSARYIKTAVRSGKIKLDLLFKALLEKQEKLIYELLETNSMSIEPLVLFGYTSMAPSIETGAEQLETYLKKEVPHKKGYCPICGNHPNLSFFDANGKRHLNCSFCNHQWEFTRIGCAFCETTEPEALQYFYSDEEKEYRVDLCNRCRNYIKVVDTRHMERHFFPDLEVMSTLHLDMKANEIGYVTKSAVGLD